MKQTIQLLEYWSTPHLWKCIGNAVGKTIDFWKHPGLKRSEPPSRLAADPPGAQGVNLTWRRGRHAHGGRRESSTCYNTKIDDLGFSLLSILKINR